MINTGYPIFWTSPGRYFFLAIWTSSGCNLAVKISTLADISFSLDSPGWYFFGKFGLMAGIGVQASFDRWLL